MLKKIFRKLIKILGFLVISAALIIIGVSYYLDNHKHEFFEIIKSNYTKNYYGDIAFDDISINTLKNFPNLAVTLKNVAATDSISNSDYGSLQLEQVFFTVSLKNILNRTIQFKSLKINNGKLNLLNGKKNVKPLRKLFSKRINDTLNTENESLNLILKKNITIIIKNVDVSLENYKKNKRITALINEFNTQLSFSDSIINAEVKMNIQMNELGLNLTNGTFFNDSNLIGEFPVTINKKTQQIEIPFFNLNIDDQLFKTKSIINIRDKGKFNITLENSSTNLKSITPLLSQNIQKQLKKYSTLKPIYTHTEIEGGMESGSIPLIKIKCETKNNDIFINENIHLKKVSFSADFINNTNSKKRIINSAQKKDFQITLNKVIANFNNASINFDHVYLQTKFNKIEPVKNNNSFPNIDSKLIIQNGHFKLADSLNNKRISGYINELNADLNFNKNTIQSLIQMNIQMEEMGLNLKNGTFFNNANLVGNITSTYNNLTKHIETPFFKLNIDNQQFKAKADINTNGTGSFNFVLENPQTKFKETSSLLTQNIQEKLNKYKISNPLYTHTTIEGSFEKGNNPLVSINFKTIDNDITINDSIQFKNVTFSGNMINRVFDDERRKLESKKNIKINLTTLKAQYQNIFLNFNYATLISTPKTKNYVDYEFTVKQSATILNSFFNNTEFIFTKGTLDLITRFKGDIKKLDNLYYKSNSRLKLQQSNILHKTLNLEFPINKLDVKIIDANGFLETLIIPINKTDNHLIFKGQINNFTSLILDGGDPTQTNLELFSENLIWKDFFAMFRNLKKNKNRIDEEGETVLFNETIRVIQKKFNPKFNLILKEFKYNETHVKNLTSEIFFTNKHLYLKKTGFNYRDGEVSLAVIFDISKTDEALFDINLEFTDIDLNPFLKEFNYFEISSLKETDKIAGIISLDTEMSGLIHEVNGLDTKSLEGSINFNLRELELNGFEPIQKIGDKIFKKKRFENISFADISKEIYVTNRTVEVPRMEIQSTAFNLFIEGYYSYDNNTNFWISIPLANLKKRHLVKIPDKKGFINTGKKVFIQVKTNEENKLDYKLHFSNKKSFKEKADFIQYREDYKINRKLRMQHKKMEKKTKRKLKKQEK